MLKSVPYGSWDYWEERYRNEEAEEDGSGFEWYPGADDVLCEEIEKLVPKTDPAALEIGCGSSLLARKLSDLGYRNVIVSDVSETCVRRQRRECTTSRHSLDHALIDSLHIPVRSGLLEVVIDKGTLDAIDCTDDRRTAQCLSEVHRALRSGGFYLLVSCRDPHVRKGDIGDSFHLLRVRDVFTTGGERGTCPCPDAYLYILQKPQGGDGDRRSNNKS